MPEKRDFILQTEDISLGQFLKFESFVSSGGEVKNYILTNKIFINNKLTQTRSTKIYKGDIIKINNITYVIS